MRLGRLDEETTANVGMIQGGAARNIVPERCVLDCRGAVARRAQARGPRPGDARRLLASPPRSPDCEVETEVDASYHGYRFAQTTGRCGSRAHALARTRATSPPTALTGGGGRRQRLQRSAASRASTSRTGWPRSTRPRSTSPSPTSRGWSRSRSRSSTQRAMPLSLRRGASPRCWSAHDGLARIEVDGDAVRRVSAADRPGRARRRGGRERAGARPRARLRRVRRPLREPDPRPRARRRSRART